MRCICCNKLKTTTDKGRTIVEPDGKISSYCMECDLIVWERAQPKMLGDLLMEEEDETSSLIGDQGLEADRYD